MHELEEKLIPIKEMKEKLTEWCKTELDRGREQVGTAEMGQVIDMIKDLAETEEKCVKSAYYKCLIKEEKDEEEMGDGLMGYDNWRTSSGRFANKGTGNYRPGQSGRRGYPMPAEGDWRPEYGPWGDQKMYDMMSYNGGGSRGSSDGDRSSGRSDGDGSYPGRMGYRDPDFERYMSDERYGRPFKEWRLSKRHYTETKSDGDKHEMSEHAKEHLADTAMTLKEMWMGADPELRTKMKTDLTALLNEMK